MTDQFEVAGRHLIAGVWEAGDAQASSFVGVDPRDGRKLPAVFRDATKEQIDRALRAAATSFREFRLLDPARRAEFLDAIAEELELNRDALVTRGSAETGLPTARLEAETGRTCGQLRLFAALIRDGAYFRGAPEEAEPDRKPLPKPGLARDLIAIGPVAVFGASNFPLAFSVAGGDTASALAAGCPVVVKAHPHHPGLSELTAHAVQNAARATRMPDGVFSMLHGEAHRVGEEILQHPSLRAVGFTGSTRGGRALFDRAAVRPDPIPVFAELGSLNPVFVGSKILNDSARRAEFAESWVASLILGSGQFCTNPGLLVGLSGEPWQALLEDLQQRLEAVKPMVMLHRGIAEGFVASVHQIEAAGAELKLAPKTVGFASTTAGLAEVSSKVFLAEPRLQTECFGPGALAIGASDLKDLAAVAEALEGQLTATLHGVADGVDLPADLEVILEERVGRLLRSGYPTGVEVCAAMQHGGPWPASTDGRSTSVGSAAIERFLRPVCRQL